VRMVVVVPFLNEAEQLPAVLASLERQKCVPDQLLLVDDGSSDSSPEIAAEFARTHAYATLLRRPVRPR
jgi:CDP-glycerol glycerophosphotransferase